MGTDGPFPALETYDMFSDLDARSRRPARDGDDVGDACLGGNISSHDVFSLASAAGSSVASKQEFRPITYWLPVSTGTILHDPTLVGRLISCETGGRPSSEAAVTYQVAGLQHTKICSPEQEEEWIAMADGRVDLGVDRT